jgi:hypothetical protein
VTFVVVLQDPAEVRQRHIRAVFWSEGIARMEVSDRILVCVCDTLYKTGAGDAVAGVLAPLDPPETETEDLDNDFYRFPLLQWLKVSCCSWQPCDDANDARETLGQKDDF